MVIRILCIVLGLALFSCKNKNDLNVTVKDNKDSIINIPPEDSGWNTTLLKGKDRTGDADLSRQEIGNGTWRRVIGIVF